MGNSGILSFAHIGFMGVGAYTSAVLTIPVQMKGMALPDLYPFLQDVALSPYLGDRSPAASSRRGGGGGFLSADAALRCGGGHHLLWPAGRALHGDDALERAHQRPAHALRPAADHQSAARRQRGGGRAGRRARLQGIAHRAPPAGEPRRRGRRRRARRPCAGAALARLRPCRAACGHRRRPVGPFHHVVLAQGLLPEGDLRDPRHAGDRRRQHRDRRGRRRLHRHRRL